MNLSNIPSLAICDAELAKANAALADAILKEQAADTEHVKAAQGEADAVDAHTAIGAKMAAGEAVKPAEAASAAGAIVAAQQHLALRSTARIIAAGIVKGREEACRLARNTRTLALLRQAYAHKATTSRAIAKAAKEFSAAVAAGIDAGTAIVSLKFETDAQHGRANPYAFLDESLTAPRKFVAALPKHILMECWNNQIMDSTDFDVLAASEEAMARNAN